MGDDVAKINQELTGLSKKLALASNGYGKACRKAADSRSDYDVAKAKAMLKSALKTATERQAEATVICETEMREARTDEAMRARLDDNSMIVLRGCKSRAKISRAKYPMVNTCIEILEALSEFRPLSDRVIHYKLLNDPPLRHASKPNSTYQNDDASWKDLCDLLTRMRLESVIPFSWIADETRPIVIVSSYHDAGAFMAKETDGLLKGYYRDLQQSQAHHIEIIYEKSTGRSFVQPTAMDYCIPLTVGRGFCSLPPRVAMARRYEASGRGKLIVISMSDLDPDGDEITHSFARSMRDDFGIDGVQCVKAALTMDQVKELRLPPNKLKAKQKSANYAKYIAKHGTEDVYELEALDPAQQRQLLEDAILSVLDVDAYNYEVSMEKEEAAFLDGARQCAFGD